MLSKSEKTEILRLMIERVTVSVVGESERVKVEVAWHGGVRIHAEIRRPVRHIHQLSYYDDLCARVAALKSEGRSYGDIAAILNDSDWEPARKNVFTESCVAGISRKSGVGRSGWHRRKRPPPADRGRDEWMLDELARETGISVTTLHTWIRKGKLAAHREQYLEGGRKQRFLIHADRNTRKAIRNWKGMPPRFKSRHGIPDFRSDRSAG